MSTADSLSASGRSSEKLSLPSLQSKMKIDPEGHEKDLVWFTANSSRLWSFFNTKQLSISPQNDPAIAKHLSDRATFLAHVTPFYPKQLDEFPAQLAEFLKSSARTLPSGLRWLILVKTLALYMELQTLRNRTLRKLAFTHVVHSIRRMNKQHKNEANNRVLQNILFSMLQIEDDDSDASSGEDDPNPQTAQVVMKSMYKACHKGTVASKKKKKATLHRVICSTKRQQRLSLENSNSNCNSLFNHLKNAQGFAEKLFCRLQTSNECFEVQEPTSQLFYRIFILFFVLRKYVQVPPDAVEPLFKQIVNQFVHDRSRPEAISVGQEKRRKQNRSGEQFRGKKAWK